MPGILPSSGDQCSLGQVHLKSDIGREQYMSTLLHHWSSFNQSALDFVQICTGGRPVLGPSWHALPWRVGVQRQQIFHQCQPSFNQPVHGSCLPDGAQEIFTKAAALYVGLPTMSAVGAVDLIK